MEKYNYTTNNPEAKNPIETENILVDVLTPKQKAQLDCRLFMWMSATALFYLWWCWPTHILNPVAFVFNTFIISWPLLMPAYAYFFVRRMKRPNLTLQIPKHWRVAMIVTKAPSEPWSVAKRTLIGMLEDNSFPHDTWIADEDPTEESRTWCAEHGVRISCRKGIPEYNNLDYPRRMKCKEGNLAYFYDHWGYKAYDFVVQTDCDHKPEKGYLKAILPPFIDPKIGYVSAPSICDHNVKHSWVARARLWTEAILHGTMQAGCYNDWAPMCIGSHFAVRTSALKEIGGLGPELSEDHSTTFLLCAAGWKGAHALDAIASGRGPESFKDGMIQELQWSRSLIILLLTLTPKHIHRFAPKMKFQFLFSQLWYFMYTMSFAGAFLVSPIAIALGCAFMNINFWVFFLASLVPTSCCLYVAAWLRREGLLRPHDALLISWETTVFSMARWPIVSWAIIDAFKMTYFRNRRIWKVTPKKKEKPTLPLQILVPYLMLIGVSLLAAFLFSPNSHTLYYYAFNILNCLGYMLLLGLVYLFNGKEREAANAT